jgi:flagellar export protein FliJ
MPSFNFKLTPVLRHRKVIEREKQRDYALALAKLQDLQDHLKSLNQSMQTSNDDVRQNHLVGRLDLSFITAHRRFLMGIQRKVTEVVSAIAKVQQEVETARLALAHAAKEVKVLEKLYETQHGRWRDEIARKENIAADEVATNMSNDTAAARAADAEAA